MRPVDLQGGASSCGSRWSIPPPCRAKSASLGPGVRIQFPASAGHLSACGTPRQGGSVEPSFPGRPGCISEGDSREQALANIQVAIQLYLDN